MSEVWNHHQSSSLSVLHVLHDQEGSAEVNKSADRVLVREQVLQHFHESLLAVFHIDQVLVFLYQLEALSELHCSVLLRHVGAKLLQVARRNVDQIVLGHCVRRRLRDLTLRGPVAL